MLLQQPREVVVAHNGSNSEKWSDFVRISRDSRQAFMVDSEKERPRSPLKVWPEQLQDKRAILEHGGRVRSSNVDRSNVRHLLDIPVEVSNGQLDKPKAKNKVWLRNKYISCLHIQSVH